MVDDFFYKLYGLFLEIDSIASICEGRNRKLIISFFGYFSLIAQKQDKKDSEILKEITEAKIKLKQEFKDYCKINSKFRLPIWNLKQHSTYGAILKNPNISEFFLEFLNAVKKYSEWRSKLGSEQLLLIYKKNLIDRQQYYTNDKKVFEEINKILESVPSDKLDNNKIIKQSLIEFHNAISHLVSIFYGNTEESNIKRAINHFKRGALDSYKSIIKDYYLLKNSGNILYELDLEKKLINIRENEFRNMGTDNNGDLLKKYENMVNDIINNLP
ncbi:hypothetical protein AJY72_00180 [Campylobacter jejuni]|uniref:hypothetical protein n=1 Tax=Campylobacter jejuni TaxID=197 RepID=UPI00069738EE|nr:hypothetical protein [Campylobacter jejuni]ECK7568718.1 hypothetical protein [Campylobacter coli]ECL2728490.1 hypothetical protein [Campylobacter coli]ECL3237417.1 hypothetical protein [Campylobacter coli]ECO5761679.1 hypothetical protein [Campylobacter coli]ECP7230366.1 hypothetical protein [Campylobacter jejuni]